MVISCCVHHHHNMFRKSSMCTPVHHHQHVYPIMLYSGIFYGRNLSCWRLSSPKDIQHARKMLYMSTPSTEESTSNGASGERSDVNETLRITFGIEEQLAALSRKIGHLTTRMAESERQRAGETAYATVIKAAEKTEEELRKRCEITGCNSYILSPYLPRQL